MHTLETRLAVRDGVERGHLEGLGVVENVALALEQGTDRTGHLGREGHLDKNERLLGERRMEVGKQTPIRLKTAAQVGPAVDLVHGLVGDDLLEQASRRIPAQLFEPQKARIEPGRQEVMQVGIHRLQLRKPFEVGEQFGTQAHQHAAAMGHAVQAAKELLPRGFGHRHQGHQVSRTAGVGVAGRRLPHLLTIGVEIGGQGLKKGQLALGGEGLIAGQGPLSQALANGLSCLTEQSVAVVEQTLEALLVGAVGCYPAKSFEHDTQLSD